MIGDLLRMVRNTLILFLIFAMILACALALGGYSLQDIV